MSDQFVWQCPSCGRRVPRKVEDCRCGFRQPDSETVIPASSEAEISAAPSPSSARRIPWLRSTPWLLLGLLATVALAAIPLRSLWNPAGLTPDTTKQSVGPARRPAAPPTLASSPTPPTPPTLTPATLPTLPTLPTPPNRPASLEDIVAQTLPAVVSIEAGRSRGTGFFVQPQVVLTNAHVVSGQTTVQLQLGETKYTARVMGLATGTDLAVLHVAGAPADQPTLRLGSVRDVRVGQEVVAIGSALGVLSNTVTRGIVSAVRHTGAVTLIQTDAAINPGNSGGPLVDRTGLVIGINSMRVAQTTGEGPALSRAEGLAFAVAVDHAVPLLRGQPQAPATATPVEGLNQMMSAPSQATQLRERGEQVYRKALEWAARNGEQLDSYWDRYARTCVTSAPRTGDRAWFAVLEPAGVRMAERTAYDCQTWLDTVRSNANTVKAEVARAAEAARQDGVYPGVLRDLRRQYKMDWPGWER